MANEQENEINFEKAQSVIADYVNLRDTMRGYAVAILILGILALIFTTYLVVVFPIDFEAIEEESPDSVEETNNTDREVNIDAVVAIVQVIIVLGGYIFGLTLTSFGAAMLLPMLYKRSETIKTIHSVHNSVIRKSYFINFELVSPVGNTRLERLANHLGLVFPEIGKKLKRGKKTVEQRQKSLRKIKSLKEYDLMFNTVLEQFIVKIFDKHVTLVDIESVCEQMNKWNAREKWISNDVQRVIILSDSYDDIFTEPDFNKKLDRIKRNFKLDLILEEDEHGYAIIHLDY